MPDKWIEKNNLAIANFIRSQREVFDSEEAEEILASRTHYSAGELTLVDWEGAVIIAPKADFESDVALLKIGSYQILRYRMLDQSIEEMLDKINERFFPKRGRPRPDPRPDPPDHGAPPGGDDRFRARRTKPAPDRRLVYRQTV